MQYNVCEYLKTQKLRSTIANDTFSLDVYLFQGLLKDVCLLHPFVTYYIVAYFKPRKIILIDSMHTNFYTISSKYNFKIRIKSNLYVSYLR